MKPKRNEALLQLLVCMYRDTSSVEIDRTKQDSACDSGHAVNQAHPTSLGKGDSTDRCCEVKWTELRSETTRDRS